MRSVGGETFSILNMLSIREERWLYTQAETYTQILQLELRCVFLEVEFVFNLIKLIWMAIEFVNNIFQFQ